MLSIGGDLDSGNGPTQALLSPQAKLDLGEECLSTALPCDVAGLVKQFFRELPEPVLPAELQESFLRAQQLSSAEDRVSATLLLSCVLPHRNLTLLQYFFSFLYDVSQRCILPFSSLLSNEIVAFRCSFS